MKRMNIVMLVFLMTTYVSFGQDLVMVEKHNTVGKIKNEDSNTGSGYTFEFMAFTQTDELKKVTDDMAGTHFLGQEIAKKMYLFNETYCYKEPIAPGSSATKTMFRKLVIYNSVKKIEHYLKKSVKGGGISVDVAAREYNKVLDVALNILDVNTENFENRIKSASGPESMLSIYVKEVKLNFIN